VLRWFKIFIAEVDDLAGDAVVDDDADPDPDDEHNEVLDSVFVELLASFVLTKFDDINEFSF
jgi:hypothetical protein